MMNDNTRLGSLLVFKAGTAMEEAAAALRSIRHLLDLPEGGEWVKNPDFSVRWVPGPLKVKDMVQKFDPEHGSPVWYIP
jgi:hypothetical protein